MHTYVQTNRTVKIDVVGPCLHRKIIILIPIPIVIVIIIIIMRPVALFCFLQKWALGTEAWPAAFAHNFPIVLVWKRGPACPPAPRGGGGAGGGALAPDAGCRDRRISRPRPLQHMTSWWCLKMTGLGKPGKHHCWVLWKNHVLGSPPCLRKPRAGGRSRQGGEPPPPLVPRPLLPPSPPPPPHELKARGGTCSRAVRRSRWLVCG